MNGLLEQLLQLFQKQRNGPSDLYNNMYSYSDTPGQGAANSFDLMRQKIDPRDVQNIAPITPQESKAMSIIPRSAIEHMLTRGLDSENNTMNMAHAYRNSQRNLNQFLDPNFGATGVDWNKIPGNNRLGRYM